MSQAARVAGQILGSLIIGVVGWLLLAWIIALLDRPWASPVIEWATAVVAPLTFGPLVALLMSGVAFFCLRSCLHQTRL